MIDPISLKSKLNSTPQARDYTFGVIFLILSSFFIFFVIKPVLGIALSLQKEKRDLAEVESKLNKNFSETLRLKNILETSREDEAIINDVIPNRPNISESISLVYQIFDSVGVRLVSMNIEQATLLKGEKVASHESFLLRSQFVTNKTNLIALQQKLNSQNRLFSLKSLKVTQNAKNPTEDLGVQMVLDLSSWW